MTNLSDSENKAREMWIKMDMLGIRFMTIDRYTPAYSSGQDIKILNKSIYELQFTDKLQYYIDRRMYKFEGNRIRVGRDYLSDRFTLSCKIEGSLSLTYGTRCEIQLWDANTSVWTTSFHLNNMKEVDFHTKMVNIRKSLERERIDLINKAAAYQDSIKVIDKMTHDMKNSRYCGIQAKIDNAIRTHQAIYGDKTHYDLENLH